MANRLDYVKYDEIAIASQNEFKAAFKLIEGQVDLLLKSPRAKALVLTYLEISYMWIGKAIRDDQIARNGSAPLQEERNNE